ncbi:fibronectin type III domain-containing protein [Pseudofulvibacter geojedonensis]|uniref:Fibronectin type III domain-containing protein n=1 Tax=Pseudofulvibacter geojedonensis TaxID=1123758 RepID=A0ABW3I4E8_9FLAO
MKNSGKLLIIFLILLTHKVISQNINPYLQAAKPTSIWVSWKTDNGTNPSVSYGTTSTNLSTTVNGTTVNLSPQDSGYTSPYHWHNVQLTGLTPNTGYYYKVQSGSSDESAVHYFKTPPNYGNNNEKLRFIVLGDHQLINYQGQPYSKFNELVQAAKSKAEELYGTPLADHFNLIINDGDQVDYGNLTHYEKIHFEKQRYITPNLPLITAVGNHELYGAMGLNAYYEHFILDNNFDYQGINSGTERYYAYQMSNVLFVVLDTELNGTTQLNWVTSVLNAAATDTNVDWIITISHRPYQAEQYSNDYSPWYGTNVLPILKTNNKFALHIAGHHHLYSRGQFKDHPGYHIISGGTAWPQYWGDSSNETDHEETQGSWSNFAYQLVEIDNASNEMKVESYTIGSLTTTKNNTLLDSFHIKRGIAVPNKPSITNNITNAISLPYTFNSSAYNTSTGEAYNSTQFQISAASDFSVLERDTFRNHENFYGPLNGQTDETIDIGLGAGIFNLDIGTNQLNNGTHYIRVRHRDKALNWSEWSDTLQFEITGSVDGQPAISLDKPYYNTNETITVSYANGPGNAKDWIGIYQKGQTPGSTAATAWSYVNGNTSGTVNFSITTSGEYFVSFFENDGYTQLTNPIHFWVGNIPTLSSNKTEYAEGEDVLLSYATAPNNSQDWIGIYKVGTAPATGTYTSWQYVNNANGTQTYSNLPKGYYYATYHLKNGYSEIGERIYFQVGTQITTITTNKTEYELNENITVSFTDGPGKEKDWLGIYKNGENPGTDQLFTYKYFGGLANGVTTIDDSAGTSGQPNQVPDTTGDYFIVMFTDDSYNEVSNRVYFSVVNNVLNSENFTSKNNVSLYPNPIQEYAYVDTQHPISKLEIYDLSGKKVYEVKHIGASKVKIEKQFLPAGKYLLKVYSDKIYNLNIIIK